MKEKPHTYKNSKAHCVLSLVNIAVRSGTQYSSLVVLPQSSVVVAERLMYPPGLEQAFPSHLPYACQEGKGPVSSLQPTLLLWL